MKICSYVLLLTDSLWFQLWKDRKIPLKVTCRGVLDDTDKQKVIFTIVPCILILSKSFIYQMMHNRIALKEY